MVTHLKHQNQAMKIPSALKAPLASASGCLRGAFCKQAPLTALRWGAWAFFFQARCARSRAMGLSRNLVRTSALTPGTVQAEPLRRPVEATLPPKSSSR